MAVLDTTFLIAVERGDPRAVEGYAGLVEGPDALRVPAAVWTEYLSGFDPGRRPEARRVLEAAVTFEPFARVLADEAARLQHELLRAGAAVGWHDLQVAATALHYDEPLVTSDDRFERVPGLAVWTH